LGDEGSRGAAAFLASAAAAEDPMKSILVKGNHFLWGMDFSCLCRGPDDQFWSKATIFLWEMDFSCLCHRPNEINFGQRQLCDLGIRNSVASAVDPMKSR
jgi:hypothetical protein